MIDTHVLTATELATSNPGTKDLLERAHRLVADLPTLSSSALGLSKSIAAYRAELETLHRRIALDLQYHALVKVELDRLVDELHQRESQPPARPLEPAIVLGAYFSFRLLLSSYAR